ncbi:hypothetical protein LINPERPRIM_LOCUS34201 [Linum perenne]
MRTSLHWEH